MQQHQSKNHEELTINNFKSANRPNELNLCIIDQTLDLEQHLAENPR